MSSPVGARSYRGPSALFYVLAVAIIVTGAALGIFLFLKSLARVDDAPQLVVPGEHALDLDETGTYDVFVESHSVIDGQVYSNPSGVPGMSFYLRRPETGQEVTLEAQTSRLTYSFGDRSGRGILNFTIDEPGSYVLTAAYTSENGPPAVLSVVREFGAGLLTAILGGLASVVVSLGLGLTMIILVSIKRRKARKFEAATLRMRSPWSTPGRDP